MDMARMLGEELQKGIVPEQRPVLGIEDADGHFKLVEGACHQAEDGDQRCSGKRRNCGIIGEALESR
ncbi:hypothetical protein D3C71_2090120 [compost metagenome]